MGEGIPSASPRRINLELELLAVAIDHVFRCEIADFDRLNVLQLGLERLHCQRILLGPFHPELRGKSLELLDDHLQR